MERFEQVFGGRMSFLTKPARIREQTLDLATASLADKFSLYMLNSEFEHLNSLLILK